VVEWPLRQAIGVPGLGTLNTGGHAQVASVSRADPGNDAGSRGWRRADAVGVALLAAPGARWSCAPWKQWPTQPLIGACRRAVMAPEPAPGGGWCWPYLLALGGARGAGSTINGVMTPKAPPGRRHRKKLRNRVPPRALLAIAAVVGLALIVAITVPAVLGAASRQPGRKVAPTVTVSVPVPQPTVTVTVPRPGPTITVTQLRPGPTVTIRCRHPGRQCGGA
jgi:hypothetical protein